ncbi:MAG: acyloxyacyl hydrolase [Verrucomicrobiota bacterium]
MARPLKQSGMKWLMLSAVFIFPLISTFAASEAVDESSFDLPRLFDKGQQEASLGAEVLFSPFIATKSRPTENYAGGFGQIGYMFTQPNTNRFISGNLEGVAEGYGTGTFTGSGRYTAGMTLWLRYNFIPRDCRFVPYAQVGAGTTFSDLDHQIFGGPFFFNLDIALGTRYFLKKAWSLNAEYRFQHVSNANTSNHNLGLNAQGATLSVSWFF